MIVHKPTFGSNVISPISSITILGGLMSGSICMFEVLFSVYCVFDLKMMIQVNGVFALIRGSTSMEFIDFMDVFWFRAVGACIAWGGCIRHLNIII
jgi:hypothetical protein